MPILDIEIVLRPGETLTSDLAAALAQAAAGAFGASPGRTWVKLRSLPADHYAEDRGGPPEGVAPVFVKVLKAELPPATDLRTEAARLTQAIARACNRPAENVHVLYEPGAQGRLAFGGELLRD